MHVRVNTVAKSLLLAAIIGVIAACGTGASYATKMAYLVKVANEGVQTHKLIVSQGGTTNAKRCTDAYNALKDQSPPDDTGAGPSNDWLDQVQAFFVESCVTGLPKPVPGQSATTGPSPSSSSAASSAQPTATASPSPTKK